MSPSSVSRIDQPRHTLAILLLIIAFHVGFAAWYASVTPYRTGGVVFLNPSNEKDIGAPDERQHVNYVAHLSQGLGFPIFKPGDPDLYETYQSHQPPLFYLIATAWSKALGIGEFESRESGLKLRALNIILGAGTVAGVFFLGFWGLKNTEISLAAAAFAGLLPMFVALSGAVSNDSLLMLLCTWTLAVAALCMQSGWTWPRVITLGALLGLAFLTKTTALALVPTLIVVLFLKSEFRPGMAKVAASVGIALLFVAPWWARNQSLYHDPLAIKAFSNAFKMSAQKETIVQVIQMRDPGAPAELTYWKDWVGWFTARSFVGTFGYMDIWLNESGTAQGRGPNTLYRFFIALILGLLAASLVALSRERDRLLTPVHVMNAVFFAVVALLFVRFNMQYFQAQGRYLLPAIGPISLAIGMGAIFLAKNRPYVGIACVALTLVGLNGYVVSRLPSEFDKRTSTYFPPR